MKKLSLITLFVSAFAFITSAYAGTISGNAGVTSNYLFRGVSQDDGASVNAGLTYTDGALSIGASAYSLADGTEVNYVVDYSVNEALNVGATVYSYDTAAGVDATELYAAYDLGIASVSFATTTDGANDGDTAIALSYGFDITEGVTGSLTYGEVEDDSNNANDYDYLQLDVSYESLTVSLVDADDNSEVAVSYGFNF
jgi:uncharacterized protein (TIGR02001 family)